ncbi:hypothetical protein RDI58_002685 [Solanum bulbocastanum]|uniref:Uncharacterized protein n=1 Tax=Solanum bulbocastanum TaxID=147425 RepID=A0AAN8YRE4_SOLBU
MIHQTVKVSELNKEVDQKITIHSTVVLQPVEPHQLASSSRLVKQRGRDHQKGLHCPKSQRKLNREFLN